MTFTIGTVLSWIVIKPFVFLFKIGLRRIFVCGFLLTILISSIIVSIKNQNITMGIYEFSKNLVAVDNIISETIRTIATEEFNIWGLLYIIWKGLGAIYFTWFLYIELFLKKFASKFTDTPIAQFMIFLMLILPLSFFIKFGYYTIAKYLLEANIELFTIDFWFNCLPMNFIIVFFQNINAIALKIEPLIDSIKGLTQDSVLKNDTIVGNMTNNNITEVLTNVTHT